MSVGDVDSITMLGAGNVDHDTAEVAALIGYNVILRDIEDEFAQQGCNKVEWSLDKLAERDRLSQNDADAALARVSTAVDLGEAVTNTDVVIEAIPEKVATKKEVYVELGEYAPDHAVFVTSTSSFSITELPEVTEHPERFCGIHFFNPLVRMDLVEVISSAHTADETLDLVEDLVESMGKTSICIRKDNPGFIVNRISVPLMNGATWIVRVGNVTMTEVDATTRYDMGLLMGSFELADYVDIDVDYHVLEYMHEVLDDTYGPCPFLLEKVGEGDLDQKTGAGFHDYEGDAGTEIPHDEGSGTVKNRLLDAMANGVVDLAGNGVADSAAIDRAAKLGGRLPDGPARMTDNAGTAALVDALDGLHDEAGETRYEAVEYLRDLAQPGEGFYGNGSEDESGDASAFNTIAVEMRNDVSHITPDQPH